MFILSSGKAGNKDKNRYLRSCMYIVVVTLGRRTNTYSNGQAGTGRRGYLPNVW